MSYTASFFHIVFCTHQRQPVLNLLHKEELLRYIYGISEHLKCNIISLNMMPEHIHVLVDINAEVALAKYVATVKQSTSKWLKTNINFVKFRGWAKEYYGVSVSPTVIENVKKYIANQEQHHTGKNFSEEIRWLVETIGLKYYEESF